MPSLYLPPSRIVVGEVRAEECRDLLLALNPGVPGVCTLHANSAREALVKMCTLPLLAGENVSARFAVPTVAASVDLVVHLGIDHHGVRRVNEIVGVPGRVEHDVNYEGLGIDVHARLAAGLMGVGVVFASAMGPVTHRMAAAPSGTAG